MPGSCSSGFRSRPSSAGGVSRSKGLEVSSTKSRKPTLTKPITPSTRATIGSGRRRDSRLTASVQPESMNTHSSIEPSWLPQVAARR